MVGYPHVREITTRWKDNDVYGHVNNVEYYSYFDTVINAYLIRAGGLDIHRGDVIGLCVESHCRFDAALEFPGTIDAGLRVAQLGRSSARYEIGLFAAGAEQCAAQGWFVHARIVVERAGRYHDHLALGRDVRHVASTPTAERDREKLRVGHLELGDLRFAVQPRERVERVEHVRAVRRAAAAPAPRAMAVEHALLRGRNDARFGPVQ